MGGEKQSSIWAKTLSKLDYLSIVSVGATYSSTYHTKLLNLWPTLPTSHVVIYNLLFSYLFRKDGAI